MLLAMPLIWHLYTIYHNMKNNKEFYKPKEVLETMIEIIDNPKFNENIASNHLMILGIALSKSNLYRFGDEGKFYLDLIRLCQTHISCQNESHGK